MQNNYINHGVRNSSDRISEKKHEEETNGKLPEEIKLVGSSAKRNGLIVILVVQFVFFPCIPLLLYTELRVEKMFSHKGSSQLAKKIFEKKQRESIDNGVNSKCVKFYVPL